METKQKTMIVPSETIGSCTLSDIPLPPAARVGWPWTEATNAGAANSHSAANWPRISIVTPSYNQGPFIEETIRSVLLQGYPNLEYIVIDGGSTDNTREILEKYSPFLSYWVSEPDQGQTHAINKGMARATGEIRAYLNSDDLYRPDSLFAVARAARANPDADLFYGRCAIIDEASRDTGEVRHGDIQSLEDMLDVWGVWWTRRNYVQPEVFWTKRIAQKVGPFREDLYFVMDHDYWLRIFLAGGGAHKIDQELAAFRLWANQKSSTGESSATELMACVRPRLWDISLPLRQSLRHRLQGDWLYANVFLPEVERLITAGLSPRVRWLRLSLCVVRHPQMLLSRGLSARLRARSVRPA